MHRSKVELLDYLYGVAEEDTHVGGCAECQAQLEEMRGVRQRTVTLQPELRADFLTQQRARIWQQIETSPSQWGLMKPVSAAAAVALMVAGVFFWNPRPSYSDEKLMAEVAAAVETTVPKSLSEAPLGSEVASGSTMSTDRLFDEIQSDLSVPDPRAAAPLHGLYSEAK